MLIDQWERLAVDFSKNTEMYCKCDYSAISEEIMNELCEEADKASFWYRVGVCFEGPLYMGFYNWLNTQIPDKDSKWIFVSDKCKGIYEVCRHMREGKAFFVEVTDECIETLDTDSHNLMIQKLKAAGVFDKDSVLIDWGYDAKLQSFLSEYIEGFDKTFYYCAIANTDVARKNVYGKKYYSYIFDHYNNYSLQADWDFIAEKIDFDTNIFRRKLFGGIIDYTLVAAKLDKYSEIDYSPERILEEVKNLEDIWAARSGVEYTEIPEGKEINYYNCEDKNGILHYRRWMRGTEHCIEVSAPEYSPSFTVIVYGSESSDIYLQDTIFSIESQNYSNYKVVVINSGNPEQDTEEINHCIQTTDSEYIIFVEASDIVETNALNEIAVALNDNKGADCVYSDEDEMSGTNNVRHMPFFKPEWSEDFFLYNNYLWHLSALRTEKVRKIGGLDSNSGALNFYDLMIRMAEADDGNGIENHNSKKIIHIAKVLYHNRCNPEGKDIAKVYSDDNAQAAKVAKENYLSRNNIAGCLEFVPGVKQYRVVYDVCGNPKVSIIIPSMNNYHMLRQCIEAIIRITDYCNYEIIVVDNGSNSDTRSTIEKYISSVGAKYIYNKMDFNFSRMCNLGADYAEGEYLLFLNDDVEVFQSDWLNRMLGQAQQRDIGIVGAKLLYPKSTMIQHAGVTCVREGPCHILSRCDDSVVGINGLNWAVFNCMAVTGACLMVSYDVFCKVNGFDESLPVAYNDVAFCLSVYDEGYRIVQRNDVVAYHHESFSRGSDNDSADKYLRLSIEKTRLYDKYPLACATDKYLSPHLSKYGSAIEFINRFDEVSKIELNDAEEKGEIYIDEVEISDGCILIEGWSFIEDDCESYERFLVLKDPVGDMYKIPVTSLLRMDVVEAFNDNVKFLYSGFCSFINQKIIKCDILRYSIGVMSVTSDGRSYITWANRRTDIIRNKASAAVYSESETVRREISGSDYEVKYALDENVEENDGFRIKGYAFKYDIRHFNYKKSVILESEDEEILQFSVQDTERIDIAAIYPEIPFLVNSGFECRIMRNLLKKNVKYSIIIRLENCFDSSDIVDVRTEYIICY